MFENSTGSSLLEQRVQQQEGLRHVALRVLKKNNALDLAGYFGVDDLLEEAE